MSHDSACFPFGSEGLERGGDENTVNDRGKVMARVMEMSYRAVEVSPKLDTA